MSIRDIYNVEVVMPVEEMLRKFVDPTQCWGQGKDRCLIDGCRSCDTKKISTALRKKRKKYVVFFHQERMTWTKLFPNKDAVNVHLVMTDGSVRRNIPTDRRVSTVTALGPIQAFRQTSQFTGKVRCSQGLSRQRDLYKIIYTENNIECIATVALLGVINEQARP